MNTHLATARSGNFRTINGLSRREHRFDVPLDYQNPELGSIEVFAREVTTPANRDNTKLPWMIYFQGGPGFPANRPADAGGWIGEAAQTHRVLLLDQRGTGLSSRILPQTLAKFSNAKEQADYLTHFRADNIVRDAESIRQCLLGENSKWKGLGQSYGGFCLLSYLSLYPESLDGVLITGGVAGIKQHIDDIYRHTYREAIAKCDAYYRRYPEDEAKVQRILRILQQEEVQLPSGARLTDRRFQAIGLCLGSGGGFETLHFLLEKAFVEGTNGEEIANDFLAEVEAMHDFDTNPIYCIMHESIYAEGYATQWSAERLRAELPEFDLDPAKRVYFTAEMVGPDMLEDFVQLRPLKECAEILANKSDWGQLYDLDQLSKNKVPVAALSYYEDLYVPIQYSRETAQHIPHFHQWVTNEWEHDGIRAAGPQILTTLLKNLELAE